MKRQKIIMLGSNSKKNYFVFALVFACLAFLVIVILSLPVFSITDVAITGNNIVSFDEIKEKLGISENQNINTFFPSAALENILKIPYVMSAKVNKEYPNKIVVEIIERTPRAYVKVKSINSYLLIDDTGMVLEVTGFAKEKLPVIVGLKFTDFEVGQALETENKKSFENIVMVSSILKSNNLSDSLEVEISDENDIHLYVGGVDVIFGNIDDANEKMLTVIEVMKKLPKGARGFLDVKSDLQKATFSYLK